MDVDGWIEFARRDLEAARLLKNSSNRLPVGFHCQQAIEQEIFVWLESKLA